jgi:hypothetical protein
MYTDEVSICNYALCCQTKFFMSPDAKWVMSDKSECKCLCSSVRKSDLHV